MLISNNYSINNQQIYKNQSNPIKYNQTSFKGLFKDIVQFSKTNKNDDAKTVSQKDKTSIELMELGFSKEKSEHFINAVCNENNFVDKDETLKYITKDVPNIEDEDMRRLFVVRRYQAFVETKNPNDDILDKTTPKVINKDKFKFFTDTFKKYPSLQSQASLEDLLAVTSLNDKKSLDKINKFIDKDENAPVLLASIGNKDINDDEKILNGLKKLLNAGCSKEYLWGQFDGLFNKDVDSESDEEGFDENTNNIFEGADALVPVIDKLKSQGVNPKFVIPILCESLAPNESKQLSDFIDKASQHRTELGSIENPANDIDLTQAFIQDIGKSTLRTVDILGEDNLIKMFPLGIDAVGEVVSNLGDECINKKKIEPLIEIINPQGSIKYKDAQTKISELKKGFNNVTDKEERQNLIKEIADATNIKNSLVNESIKDPVDKRKAIDIYLGSINNDGLLNTDYDDANALIPYLKTSAQDNNQALNKKLKKIVWNSYDIRASKTTQERINLKANNYLQKMIFPNEEFNKNFSSLIEILNNRPNKSIKYALDDLPQNKSFKKYFKMSGLSYNVWTGRNENLDTKIKIEHSFDKMSENAVRNLETEFNDTIFKSLSEKEQNNIKKRLSSGGYNLRSVETPAYEGDGYFVGTKTETQLYKGDNHIEFKDLSKIYKLLNTEFSTNSYWDFDNTNENIPTAKGTFKNHIETRHDEMKRIRQYEGSDSSEITIQKVNMNDISHSLFLGNDSACCTAIGSFNDWTAPNYIKNKMVQAIELKDGDESVGNTMIYPIAVNDKIALLLDNIELKPKYQFNDKIEDGIIDYCHKFAEKLGKPDMDIYAGPNRHKLDMKNFELTDEEFQILGETDGQPVYLDFITKGMPIDYDTFEGSILKLKKN